MKSPKEILIAVDRTVEANKIMMIFICINSYLIFFHVDKLFNHLGDSRFWKSKSLCQCQL